LTAARARIGLLVALLAAGVTAPLTNAGAAATTNGSTVAVSVGPSGQLGNSWGGGRDMTADGRYITFCSLASNLVSGDANGDSDVFRRDMIAGTTTLVSTATDGTRGNNASCGASMSADGRYVAFYTQATNLAAGTDTNGQADVLVKDLLTGAVTRASVATDGTLGNNQSVSPSISADGRYVAFSSHATNLTPSQPATNGHDEVYLRDTVAGTTTMVSVSAVTASPGNSVEDEDTSISGDGRYVVFSSAATNLVSHDTNNAGDVFVRDTVTGTTTRVSVASSGGQANAYSAEPSISSDGRYVVFMSIATNLIAGRTIATPQVYLHDMQTGQTSLVSVSSAGAVANDQSGGGAISANDRYIAFGSSGSNLTACDSNHDSDGFVRDLQTGTTTRATLTAEGGQPNAGGGASAVTPDGRYVLITSWASNMFPGDTSKVGNLFRHDTTPGTTPAAPLFGVTGPAVRSNVTAVPITGCSSPGTTIHLTVRDSTHRAVLTLPVSRGQWSTKLNLSGFTDGNLSVMAYATNSLGATSARAYATLIKDLNPPTAQMTTPTTHYISRTFLAKWTGADKGSGIASYDLRWRYGRSTLSAYSYVVRGTQQLQWGFSLAATTTYCWSVRARDKAGNLSPWSPDRCGTTQ